MNKNRGTLFGRFFSGLALAAFVGFPTHAQVSRSAGVKENRAFIYHGKLVRPDGSSPNGTLSVTLKVFSPDPSLCLLWAETQNVKVDNGAFAAELGHAVNRLGGVAGGVVQDFKQAFINNPGLTINSAHCSSGNSYTPGAADDRLLTASFNDGGTVVEVANMPIKSVPFALQAEEIGGYGLANLAKISGVGSSVVYTPTEVQSLKDLLGGDVHWDMKSRKITKVADPIASDDAATKGWVLSQLGGGGGGGGSSPPDGSALDEGMIWVGDGSSQAVARMLRISDIRSSSGGGSAPFFDVSSACPAGQVLSYNSIADKISCAALTVTSAQIDSAHGSQAANLVYASPDGGTGTPAFRALAAGDLPDHDTSKLTSGTLGVNRGGTGLVPASGDEDKIYGIDASGSASEFKSIVGTGTVSVTHAPGQITIHGGGGSVTSNRLLGRYTAGSGAMEEIQIGAGLTLSGGTLSASGGGGGGGVTSVDVSVPSYMSATGGAVTTSGTIALDFQNQTANKIFAAPNGSIGAPSFRALVSDDIPALDASKITSGVVPVERGGTGLAPAAGDADLFVGVSSDGTGYGFKSITAGANVTITPTGNGIEISATGGGGGGGGGSGTVTSVGVSGLPLSVTNATTSPQISIAAASSTTAGYLTSANWNTFNNKLSTVVGHTLPNGQIWIGNGSNQAEVAFMGLSKLKNNSGAAQIPAPCTAAQTLKYNSVSDVLECASIAIAHTAVSGLGDLADNDSVDLSGADATGTLPVSKGGTGSATALSNNRVIVSSGGNIVESAAITASRALASNASGIPVASSVTSTELGYLSGVTSAIQTQLNAKQASIGYTPVNKAGDTMTGALNLPAGTPAVPSLRFGDANSGLYAPAADQIAISTAGTVAASFDAAGNINLAGNIGVKEASPSGSAAINSSLTVSGNSTRYGISNSLNLDTTANLTANRTAYGSQNIVTSNLTAANLAGFTQALYGSYNRATAGASAGAVGAATTVMGAYNYGLNQSATPTVVVANGYGSYNLFANNGTGDVTNGFGSYGVITQNNASTAMTNAYGVRSGITNSAGTMTNGYLFYGAYSGTIGTKWGVYVNGETKSYFSGSVGIGTTSPAYDLDVTGDIRASVSVNSPAFYYTSDRRLKENVRPIERPLETVQLLEGVYFDWKKTKEHDIGFIAQDVEKALPMAVKTADDGELQGKKSVKYGNIVALVVEAVKALISRSDEDRARMDRLEKENAELRLRLERLERSAQER